MAAVGVTLVCEIPGVTENSPFPTEMNLRRPLASLVYLIYV